MFPGKHCSEKEAILMADKNSVVAKITNPLTLIAVFAGLAETAGTLVLPNLDKELQKIFVWYVMLFPTALVITFFTILCSKREILYAPRDFEDPEHFMQLAQKTWYSTDTIDDSQKIKDFMYASQENMEAIADWMSSNDLGDQSFALFLLSDEYTDHRKNMIRDLGI
jgi:hypothetical protein